MPVILKKYISMINLPKLTGEEIANLPDPCKEHEWLTVALYDNGSPAHQICGICRACLNIPYNEMESSRTYQIDEVY